jgi:hypothetical protein
MCAARVRRLPGFRFETQAPPLPEVLPRMDIAVFVGFAASGPLQIPVAIESEAQFKSIFGEDAPIAWDLERGEQLYAYLGPAVRAFFRNKGQRCWVIRVAQQTPENAADLNFARYNYFPVPCLARVEFDESGNILRIRPAFARARSQGSWSDPIQVSSALLSRPAEIAGPIQLKGNTYKLWIKKRPGDALAAGELLQVDVDKERFGLLTVTEVTVAGASPPSNPLASSDLVQVTSAKSVWFKRVTLADAPPGLTEFKVRIFTMQAQDSQNFSELSIDWFQKPYSAEFVTNAAPGTVSVKVTSCPASDAPAPGSIIRLQLSELDKNYWWMIVEDVSARAGADNEMVFSGRAFLRLTAPASVAAGATCHRVSFEIAVRKDEDYSVNLSDLGFEAAHERFWASLPTDEEFYRPSDSGDPLATPEPLWSQIDLSPFPLAGMPPAADTTEMYFPLSMPLLAENYLGAIKLRGSALERDGLEKFDEDLFLDSDLIEAQTADLAGQAEFLMYLAPEPRLLKGIHAAFPIEEATLIAIPDAVHRSWTRIDSTPLPEPPLSSPPVRPEWWQFLDCNSTKPEPSKLSDCEPQSPPASAMAGVHEPLWGNFLDCSIKIIDAPTLSASTDVSDDGTFTLSWTTSELTADQFILEESGLADFSDAEPLYSGRAKNFTVYGRKTGDYFYRVRVFVGPQFSDWSNGAAVRVGEPTRWVTADPDEASTQEDFSPDTLLAVQRSALRMCAARGDLVCLLSLPSHYREDAAIAHVELLKSNVRSLTGRVSPLTSGEVNDFTYGALFHPWLIEREDDADRLTYMPPCGAVAGLFADRALSRGAWIAPANQPMGGVVSLDPPINPSRRLDLQEARINLVRQEPRGFLVLDAETLSDDPDLVQMNVRRLLILLRRQALTLGATYVFEPDSPAFRRAVDRGFTEMLDGMFERGAFAGTTPASAYQVNVSESLNTPQSVDQGRFIVELKVAPSLPMTFLTIRLVQTSDRSLATEVR